LLRDVNATSYRTAPPPPFFNVQRFAAHHSSMLVRFLSAKDAWLDEYPGFAHRMSTRGADEGS
jgi:hypothetical protein